MVASGTIGRPLSPALSPEGRGSLFAGAARHEGDRLAAEVCRRIMLPPERVRVYEWAARHRTLEYGVNSGSRYDPSITPYAVVPMDLMVDERVRMVVLPWGTQLGKSEAGINAEMFWLSVLGHSAYHVMPTLDRVRDEAMDRIFPTIESCAPLARIMSGKSEDENARRLKFITGVILNLVASGALASMIGKPIPKGLYDEVSSDRFDHSAIAEGEERQKAWPPADHKQVLLSNQAYEGTGIDYYAAECGTQFRFYVPCPHCGLYQVLAFDRGEYGLKWERAEDSATQPERADVADQTAHYRCASAECRQTGPHFGRIMNFHKRWMLPMGVWVADDERIESDGTVLKTRDWSADRLWAHSLSRLTYDEMRAEPGKEDGDGRRDAAPTEGNEDPARSRGRLGVRVIQGAGLSSSVCFHLSSLYSPFSGASFGQIARKFMKAGRLTDKFTTDWLGEPWRTPGRRLEVEGLKSLLTPSDRPGGYELGYLPPGVLAVTIVADIQDDRAIVDVRGWTEGGREGPLIWTGWIRTAKGAGLVELDHIADWAFATWGDPTRPRMRARSFAFDSGDGDRTDEVYALVRRLRYRMRGQGRFAHAIKGASTSTMTGLVVIDQIKTVSRRGKGARDLVQPIPFILVNTSMAKSMIYGSLGLDVGDESVIGMADGRRYPFPAPWDSQTRDPHLGDKAFRHSVDEHLNQVCGEEFVKLKTREQAAPKWAWVPRRGHQNHGLDAMVYQAALAERHKVHTLRAPVPSRSQNASISPNTTTRRGAIPVDASGMLRGIE